jgi:hypothetical protein
MSDDEITNDRRATGAVYAVSQYTRITSGSEPVPELILALDFEREPEEREADPGRLAGLLCGLMHYAERRGLRFDDALTDAGQAYDRQRTTFLAGDAVQRTGPSRHGADKPPAIGEIVRSRPGTPPVYQVDFITSRDWVPEPGLTPAQPFSATDRHGPIPSAALTRHLLARAVRSIEADCRDGRDPYPGDIQNVDVYLTGLCGWSGLDRATVLGAFSTVVTERDGHLEVPAPGTHPASLAATGMPYPPEPAIRDGSEPGAAAVPSSRPATQRRTSGGQR